jgi:tryptophanyl-tRNA synthetase
LSCFGEIGLGFAAQASGRFTLGELQDVYEIILGRPLDRRNFRKKIMAIKTDSTPVEAPKDPEKCNVFALYKLFATDEERDSLAARYRAGGMGYGEAKQMLLTKIEGYFAKARDRRKQLAQDKSFVENVLREGALKASAEARTTMDIARQKAGF